ncbi:hypothetical protein SAMN04488587_1934 [Methanococcoides vulcani]|uniref:Uncharacterized protein n=1 Tax=Methanococcoides vulcani TaxID=1353158 RepID=A0A1I0B4W9_9EURY|nr:hypothetical protein [Methanococcoides vulcani]SET01153.1 hypothetical protein SAMN04488587_1934 [Methanococcoides vulcani]
MMGYGMYGDYGIFGSSGGFTMIFNLLILIALIWLVSSFFSNRSCILNNGACNNKDDRDTRLSRIEEQVGSNRESLEKILKKLD